MLSLGELTNEKSNQRSRGRLEEAPGCNGDGRKIVEKARGGNGKTDERRMSTEE